MKKTKRILFYAAIAVFLAIFLYCAISLADYFIKSRQSQQTYNDLANLVDQVRPTAGQEMPDTSGEEVPDAPILVTVKHPTTGQEVQVLPEYAEVFRLNPETVGWLSIDGTNINYPVVQSALDNVDYYLYRDFYGKYDLHGCLYAREQCNIEAPSDNITIYGHRMNDMTMFGQLGKYEKKEFWQEHPYIRFDTLTQRHTYQIVTVFTTTATLGQGFNYHLFVDAEGPEDYDDFIHQCKLRALYDTGVSAQIGDRLISLSTCEYTQENGRLVVVAKRIS